MVQPTSPRPCLVCGHSAELHAVTDAVCAGADGLCQCHAYNPEQHPAERLAARHASQPE